MKMYINRVPCFPPPVQSVPPPSGDMVLLPCVPPLALMVPCRPLGRPNGHGLEGLPILLWQLGVCSQVLFENFRKAPAPNFRGCARTRSHHASVARIGAAGTCAATLNLRRAIAGGGVSRLLLRRPIGRARFKKRDVRKKYRRRIFIASAAKRLKLLRHRRRLPCRRRPIANPAPY